MNETNEEKKERILIVDDDPQISELMGAILNSVGGFQFKIADSGAKALELIDSWEPHLLLLDVNMPGLTGLEVLSLVRRRKEHVAVVLVSGNSNIEDVISGLETGADDYICKPFNPHELTARVKTQIRIKKLTDNLSEANSKLQALIEIDDLTGLYNMRSMYEKINLEISRTRRFESGIAVIMMDMDHFKRVNDDHDHLFGSFVLQEVGGIIKESLRDVDFAARYGGDEFMIVLTGASYDGVQAYAKRLKEAVSEYDFNNGEHSIELTTSMGYAFLNVDKETTITAKKIVQWADRALYTSKEKGRDRVEGINLNFEIEDKKAAA